jgi:hypothetical protein
VEGLLDIYLVGLALGLGIAAGAPGARAAGGRVLAVALIAVAAIAAGVIGVLVTGWAMLATLFGVGIGVLSFRRLAAAAIPAAALGLALLALVPAVGYLEALGAPLLAQRLRRRSDERYAGLRILAKD